MGQFKNILTECDNDPAQAEEHVKRILKGQDKERKELALDLKKKMSVEHLRNRIANKLAELLILFK